MERSPLIAWESFYVIVGSSGAALTGLQFVVIALITESRRRSTSHEIKAFSTPNVVHFCAVLLVSAIMSAPWRGLSNVSLALTGCGITGLIYAVIVFMRTVRQRTYRPVFEDWVWHVVLPFFAYALLRSRPSKCGRIPKARSSRSARLLCSYSSSAFTTRGMPSPSSPLAG